MKVRLDGKGVFDYVPSKEVKEKRKKKEQELKKENNNAKRTK